ncbi:hypothetical protein F5144DRAFT_385127 [Chaetomium tenue]|uniref:Uncharacterized protein n=1 Tax=Chaetomium tenue TaxID=1854479 RepID=A0ACB7NWL4_9PEZI|nr:hypothetical protein F5144DRAFT_385127 [Chaetomium globosum]
MPLPTPAPHVQESAVARNKAWKQPPKPAGRLRSACDTCHQCKIKCSGGTPCVPCHVSQSNCVYSVTNRLGRPKGSKNKRTLLQQGKGSNGEATAERGPGHGSGPVNDDARQQTLPWNDDQQQLLDFVSDHACDTASTHQSLVPGHSPQALFNPDLTSLMESIGVGEDSGMDAMFNHGLNAPSPLKTRHQAADSEALLSCQGSRKRHPDSLVSSNSATGAPNSPSPIFSPRGFLTGKFSECLCLQQQVRLVYQLEDLRDSQAASPSVDSVLHGVRLAQGPWDNFMRCLRCRSEENNRYVLMLFAMSIRVLLSSVQKLRATYCPADVAPCGAATTWQHFPGPHGTPGIPDIGVSVGSFQLTGETKNEVISLAIRSALREIKAASLYLWECTRSCSEYSESENTNRSRTGSSASLESLLSIDGNVNTATAEALRDPLTPENWELEDIESLLLALQRIMGLMKEDLRLFAEGQ